MGFSNKVAIITGASSGIGAETAAELAARGASVVLSGRSAVNLSRTAEECRRRGARPDQVLIVQSDVTRDEDIKNIVAKAVERFGRIDVLVNNAGSYAGGNLKTTDLADADAMYRLHVRATLLLTQTALPHLLTSKGNVVNVSSMVALRASSQALPYAMAKAAQDSFTESSALYLAKSGVRVNAVNPGFIETNFLVGSGLVPDQDTSLMVQSAAVHSHPLGRVGQARDVAMVIVFLASEDASFVTGMRLPVDGGFHLTSRPPRQAAL